MSSPKLVLRLLAVITLVAIMTGCSSTPTPTVAPTTAPTVNQQPTFNAIASQAAQTVVANLTQNAPTAAPATPTNTPLPSATVAPTSTPLPPATATATFIPWTLTPTPAAFACSITSVTPSATTSFATNASIDGIWVVKNTGLQKWLAGETDARYSSGTKLQESGDVKDLTADVAPGESYTVGIDMVTPATAGTYTTTWVVITGKITICTLNLTVLVK